MGDFIPKFVSEILSYPLTIKVNIWSPISALQISQAIQSVLK